MCTFMHNTFGTYVYNFTMGPAADFDVRITLGRRRIVVSSSGIDTTHRVIKPSRKIECAI